MIKTSTAYSAPPTTSGIEGYTGTWTRLQAAHLLRRAAIAPTKAMIQQAVDLGLEGTLDLLFTDPALPPPPINYNDDEDPNVPIGETWVNAPTNGATGWKRTQSTLGWMYQQMLEEDISIRERMVLFWINHFGISNVRNHRYEYDYFRLLRERATGNFRQLIKDITIHPAMLRFLNGDRNTKKRPNENYARELLELFTIGKGPQVGPGDYTNYTEDDILAISRSLTGWDDVGAKAAGFNEPIGSEFDPKDHDLTQKRLSERFNEVVIPAGMGDKEYEFVVDVIFTKAEVARFICRKFYRWFVYYDIDEAVESTIIEPMAQQLIADDYEIKGALRLLLGSGHFFAFDNIGPMIKCPVDYILSLVKPTEAVLSEDPIIKVGTCLRLQNEAKNLQMDLNNVPSVAGWKAYYQEPLFYRTWMDSNALQGRNDAIRKSFSGAFRFDGISLRIEPLEFVKTLDDPFDPNKLIEEMGLLLLSYPLSDGQVEALKEVLIPGLPDFEWTVEYSDHLAAPDDNKLAKSVKSKLEDTMKAIFSSAEFHLS